MQPPDFGFTPAELHRLRLLKTPLGVQKFLDHLPYHLADTAWSPRRVLAEHTAHCMEGAIFAAAALRVLGYPPLIWDLEAYRDTDHVIAIFRHRGCWGAVAKSNYANCRWRDPVYRSLRELAMSYFDTYVSVRGGRGLRTYSRPVNLKRFDHLQWMTSAKPIWFIAEYLCEIPHTRLLTRAQEKRLAPADRWLLKSVLVGHRWK
jgi:hypothetical protein